MLPFGIRDVAGQLIGPRFGSGSTTAIPVRVTLPVFTTRNEYEIAWLAVFTVAGVAVLVIWIDGAFTAVTVSASVSEIGPPTPAGGVEVTVATLRIEPASLSLCVVV